MPSITYYVIIPFIRTADGDLLALEAEEAPTRNQAEFRAAALVGRHRGDDTLVGTIVFSRTGDPQSGEFEDAVILARYGMTPENFEGLV